MPSTLATLPSHILMQIAEYLPPEEAVRFMLLNKDFYTFFDTLLKDKTYWEKAVKQYFPANNAMRRSELSNLAYLSSFDRYARLHQQYYEGLPARHVQLFSAVKLRDLLYLQKLGLRFNELSVRDAIGNNLYNTIARIGHQPTMDYVFSTVITPCYKDKDKVDRTKKDIARSFTLLAHAARLNQAKAIDEHFQWVTATKAPQQAYEENAIPLHLAAECGHLEAVTAFIAHGEAVNTPTHGTDPLHLAAGNGHDAIVETLLAHGANVRGSNPLSLLPPLYFAAQGGHLGTFNQCLQAEENPLLPTRPLEETTLLHAAIKSGNLELLNQVIAMGIFGINDTNGFGETPLLYAAKHGNFPAFKRLLALGANPRAIDTWDENSLLHLAFQSMNTAIIKTAIELEIDINIRNNKGETPLHYAARHKKTNPEHNELFDLLLEKGADIHAQTEETLETPLHYAAKNPEDTYALETLLKKGADVDAKTDKNTTPLHTLMKKPSRYCLAKLNCLVAHGADIHAMDEKWDPINNSTPIERPRPETVTGTPPNGNRTPLHQAAQHQDTAVIAALLDHGADLEARDENGNTPLHFATRRRHMEQKDKRDIIELFIQRGANLKAVNKDNETPLQYLLNHSDNFNLVDTFIAHGEVLEENALLHRLELKLCDITISPHLFFALLRAAPNLGTLTLNKCTITRDATSLDTTTLPSNALLCLKQINVSNSTMPLNYLFELLGLVFQAAPNLNGMNFSNIDEPEFNRTIHTIFKNLHEKQNHPYATKTLARIYEMGMKNINQDLFYAKKLYSMLDDAESVARVEAKLKALWSPGLFSSPQAQSTENKRLSEEAMLHAWCPGLFPPPQADHKRPSEEKGSSPKRQKPC